MLKYHPANSSSAAEADPAGYPDAFFGPDAVELQCQHKAQIRQGLRLASRSEADLELLLDLASGACSFQALAASIGKPRQTVSRWVAQEHEALRRGYIRLVAWAALQEYQIARDSALICPWALEPISCSHQHATLAEAVFQVDFGVEELVEFIDTHGSLLFGGPPNAHLAVIGYRQHVEVVVLAPARHSIALAQQPNRDPFQKAA